MRPSHKDSLRDGISRIPQAVEAPLLPATESTRVPLLPRTMSAVALECYVWSRHLLASGPPRTPGDGWAIPGKLTVLPVPTDIWRGARGEPPASVSVWPKAGRDAGTEADAAAGRANTLHGRPTLSPPPPKVAGRRLGYGRFSWHPPRQRLPLGPVVDMGGDGDCSSSASTAGTMATSSSRRSPRRDTRGAAVAAARGAPHSPRS